MKINYFLLIISALILISCSNKKGKYDASGVFEATEVLVSANGNGEIMFLNMDEGQSVSEKEVLGLIDTTQLHLKKLQLIASQKSLESRRTNVPKQVSAIQQQIKTQKQEKRRFENLVQANAANQKQLDDIDAQLQYLEKQLAAQVETLDNSNRSITADIMALDAQIDLLDDQIQKSIILSPIQGTISSKYVEPGELVVPGQTLFKVADLENMFLRAYITADQLTTIQIGQEVTVFSDLGKSEQKPYSGKIYWISDKAEFTPKTIQTRDERSNLVYSVKIAVKNDGYIKKGMYGELRIEN